MNLTDETNTSSAIDFVYVDTAELAEKLIESISLSSWAGIDIEGSSLHSFRDHVSLIQLAIDDGVYILDPLSNIPISTILSHLADKELIFHGGDYDLRMLLADYEFIPTGELFDTMLAAELLGIESVGLAAVIKDFFKVSICKAGQRSDWTKRPLTEKQLEYASTDVVYLRRIKDIMTARLEALGRLDWWRQSNRRLIENSKQSKTPTKEAWRIRGSKDLDNSELRYLRAIWQWRDDLAKSLNKPAFKIMNNDCLLKFSNWLAANPGKNPKKYNSLPKNCRGESYEKLTEHLKIARKLPKEQWPQHIIRRQNFWVEPDGDLVDKIKDSVSRKAEELGIKPQLILTRAKIEAIARSMPTSTSQVATIADLMDWQKELIAQDVMEIITA